MLYAAKYNLTSNNVFFNCKLANWVNLYGFSVSKFSGCGEFNTSLAMPSGNAHYFLYGR